MWMQMRTALGERVSLCAPRRSRGGLVSVDGAGVDSERSGLATGTVRDRGDSPRRTRVPVMDNWRTLLLY